MARTEEVICDQSGWSYGMSTEPGGTGNYKVTLVLTRDMVSELTKLINLAKMMNGRDFKTGTRPETFDVLAYREFLRQILEILYKATENSEL